MRNRTPTYDLACTDFIERYIDVLESLAKFGMLKVGILRAKEHQAVRATYHMFSKAATKGRGQQVFTTIQNTLYDFRYEGAETSEPSHRRASRRTP